jgi:2,5-furandicarboxylate decarboxylase 1
VATDSLRSWLAHLRDTSRLAVVDRTVSLRFELAAVAKRLDGKQAVLFRHPEDYPIPVVAGVASTREMFSEACGTDQYGLLERFAAATAQPRACRHVARESAPVKQCVVRDGIDLMQLLPIPVHHEKDAGNYVSAGLFIVRDKETRKQNVSIHRLMVVGPNRFTALILPRHTHLLHQRAEARGEPLDCAIVIGADPVTILASQAHAPFGVDELEIASALHDSPLEVVRGDTVDVDVPARAEIVIEGHILPNVREPEGPFGEFPKYYGPRSEKEVIEVTAITHRVRPIFHTIVPASYEHLLLGAIPREASLLQSLRRHFPVRAVHMTPGGSCRYHAVVQLQKEQEGQGRNLIAATLGNNFDIKHVFVVDPDVDIFDPEEVEWALATRFQGDRDLVVVPGAQGSKLDPSADGGISAKLGFDCTKPIRADPFRYLRIRIPGYDEVRVEDYVAPGAEVELEP